MNNLSSLLSFLLLFSMIANAQKVDYIGNKIDFLRLPLKPLSNDIKSYTISYRNPNRSIMDEMGLDQRYYMKMKYIKMFLGDESVFADVVVHVGVSEIGTKGWSQPESKMTPSNTPGGAIVMKTHCFLYYDSELVVVIRDKAGLTLDSTTVISRNDTIQIRIGDFNSRGEIEAVLHSGAAFRTHRNEVSLILLEKIQDYLFNNFDYVMVEHNYQVATIKDKKGLYADVNKAAEILLSFSDRLDSTIWVFQEADKLKLREAAVLCETALKDVNLEDDKARLNKENYGAIHFNAALAYFMLNDFAKAREHEQRMMEFFNISRSFGYIAKHRSIEQLSFLSPNVEQRLKVHKFIE